MILLKIRIQPEEWRQNCPWKWIGIYPYTKWIPLRWDHSFV